MFAVLLLALLELYFDGSIRRPSDHGYSLDGQGKVSACAAFVRISDEDFDPCGPAATSFLGGRSLIDPMSPRTSADAEYEGLLLGLEFVSKLLSDSFPGTNVSPPPSKSILRDVLKINVHGDCKTVIQHMQGRSRPRKMAKQFQKAMNLVEKIPWTISFEHIPRSENLLCDRLCAIIIQRMEEDALERLIVDTIQLAKLKNVPIEGVVSTSIMKNTTITATPCCSSISSLHDLLTYHFTTHHSLIPYSKRPFIYHSLATIAYVSLDFESMVTIGQKMEEEAKGVWLKRPDGKETSQQVQLDGLKYQLLGLERLGKENDAARLKRRHKHLFQEEWRPNMMRDIQWSAQDFGQDIGRHEDQLEHWFVPVRRWDKERKANVAPSEIATAFWIQL